MSFNLMNDKGELFYKRKVLHKVDEGQSRAHQERKVLHKVDEGQSRAHPREKSPS
ncbi:hypothetical protein [Metabacillus schmidteae]|uniref:hypothetical protein n=1 Tax=Metabacillus schmidteae TaxID=2730405 RepID=UPI0015891694|nr:hypothetical protein [Metabacillus schmidteae]